MSDRSMYSVILLTALLGSTAASIAQPLEQCGPAKLPGQSGPWDYRVKDTNIPMVENHHFTPKVELLLGGQTATNLAVDISYTLIRIPNHHRALASLMKYGDKVKSDQPPGAEFTMECFYRRAIRFAPDDTVVRLLFASYLHSKGRDVEALHEVDKTVAIAGDSGFTHYNAGLVYLDMKRYDLALKQAHRAAALEFGRTALRDKLVAQGQWQDPSAVPPAAAVASSTAASR